MTSRLEGRLIGLGVTGSIAAYKAAELVRLSWERMSAAAGIQVWTNYLLFTDLAFDTGMREPRLTGGAPRPVWNVFTSFQGRL